MQMRDQSCSGLCAICRSDLNGKQIAGLCAGEGICGRSARRVAGAEVCFTICKPTGAVNWNCPRFSLIHRDKRSEDFYWELTFCCVSTGSRTTCHPPSTGKPQCRVLTKKRTSSVSVD